MQKYFVTCSRQSGATTAIATWCGAHHHRQKRWLRKLKSAVADLSGKTQEEAAQILKDGQGHRRGSNSAHELRVVDLRASSFF